MIDEETLKKMSNDVHAHVNEMTKEIGVESAIVFSTAVISHLVAMGIPKKNRRETLDYIVKSLNKALALVESLEERYPDKKDT